MPNEAIRVDVELFSGTTSEEMMVLLRHIWPLIEEYWKEARPPGFPEKAELNFEALTREICTKETIIVLGKYRGKLVAFLVGHIRQGLLCRDLIGYIQTAYLRPEYRGAHNAVRMGTVLRKELLRAGAKHIFWDRMKSCVPYRAETVMVTTKKGK